jgi:hypothetical protein
MNAYVQKPCRIIKRKEIKSNRYVPGIIPQRKEQWIALADDLLEWAERDDSRSINKFALSKKYSPYKFKKWGKHNEYFANCLERATYMISERREELTNQGEMKEGIWKTTLPLYDKDYREWRELEIQKTKELTGPQFVVLEQAPSHPLVEKKKKQDEHVMGTIRVITEDEE